MVWTSCDDEAFLAESPRTFYTVENAFSSSAQVDQALVSCYSQIRLMCCMVAENQHTYAFVSGNGTDMFDIPSIRRGNRFNDYGILNATHSVFSEIYKQFYQLIAKANLALYAAELPQIEWASADDKAYAMAQARFFRAFALRNLGELYGGVPIVTEITTSPRYDFERASRVETYQFAIEELEAILNDLPETIAQRGRIVRGAAQHNLVQLYVDKGIALEEEGKSGDAKAAYDNAVSYGNQLIDGNIFRLMTERFGVRKDEDPDFYCASVVEDQIPENLYSALGYPLEGNVIWDMFQEGNQDYQNGNFEAIWCAQIDFDDYMKEDGQSLLQNPREYGPSTAQDNIAITRYISGQLEDVGGRCVVFITPTLYTRDLIYEDKWWDDMRNSETCYRRTILGNVPGSPYYQKPVPWSVIYREGEGKDAEDAGKTLFFPISVKFSNDVMHVLSGWQGRSYLFRDEYLIRLAETVLLRAEAKMRGGDNAGAAADINLLRSRAKCGYMVQASDVNLDLILDERARELTYEEKRWNTLLRMGGTVAMERIKKYAYWDDPRATMVKNFNLWPIPQSVIDTNKDKPMAQNPGW